MPIKDDILSYREFFSTGEVDTCYSKTPIAIHRCAPKAKFSNKNNQGKFPCIFHKISRYKLKSEPLKDRTEITFLDNFLTETNNIY